MIFWTKIVPLILSQKKADSTDKHKPHYMDERQKSPLNWTHDLTLQQQAFAFGPKFSQLLEVASLVRLSSFILTSGFEILLNAFLASELFDKFVIIHLAICYHLLPDGLQIV